MFWIDNRDPAQTSGGRQIYITSTEMETTFAIWPTTELGHFYLLNMFQVISVKAWESYPVMYASSHDDSVLHATSVYTTESGALWFTAFDLVDGGAQLLRLNDFTTDASSQPI